MPKKSLIILLIGIPLFIAGLIGALNNFESDMNVVDKLVTEVAPALPPKQGDAVRVLAICLLVFFCTALPVGIENLAKKYL